MPRMRCRIIETPVGPLTLLGDSDALREIRFGRVEGDPSDCALLTDAAAQLEAYFSGARRAFSIPLRPEGTPFQRAVWQALAEIPYGQTASYGDIARRIGRPKACRAVGGAIHRNPIPVIIPCHRVIGSDGSLTGFAPGLDKKIVLLQLEGISF